MPETAKENEVIFGRATARTEKSKASLDHLLPYSVLSHKDKVIPLAALRVEVSDLCEAQILLTHTLK